MDWQARFFTIAPVSFLDGLHVGENKLNSQRG